MNVRSVSTAWVVWGLLVTGTILYAGKAFSTNSSIGISIPQCNNVSVVSAAGTTIVLNCGSVQPTPQPPPGSIPPGVIVCTGFTNTVVLEMNWQTPVRMYATMGVSTAVVVKFTTGSVSTTTSLPLVAGAEYNSPPSSRIAKLSPTPCDFSTQPTPGANMVGNPIAQFAISPGSGFGFYPVLQTNTSYYLNVKNDTSPSCASTGVCDMFFDLVKVGGL